MRVGIICEGSTDLAILKVILEATLGNDIVFSKLQPDFDRLRLPAGAQIPTGWQAVRAFLREAGPTLEASPLEIIIVQVDADIRHLAEMRANFDQPDASLEELCDHVKSWMSVRVPANVIVVLPREATETWLLAAHTNLKHVEAVEDPAEELASRDLVARSGKTKKPVKDADRYAELAVALAPIVTSKKKLARVSELERFATKVRAHLKKGKSIRTRAE